MVAPHLGARSHCFAIKAGVLYTSVGGSVLGQVNSGLPGLNSVDLLDLLQMEMCLTCPKLTSRVHAVSH